MLDALLTGAQREEAGAYVRAAAKKSDLERTELQKDKSGVFTGVRGGWWGVWVWRDYGVGGVFAGLKGSCDSSSRLHKHNPLLPRPYCTLPVSLCLMQP